MDLAIVDIETTGLNPHRDRIIEIGIILLSDTQPTTTFHSLINPHRSLPQPIASLTGITPVELSLAPSFTDLGYHLFTLLQDRLFVAHNARFDYSFLSSHFKQMELSFKSKQLCTLNLSRKHLPHFPSHALSSLAQTLHLPVSQAHRALSDCHTTLSLLEYLSQASHRSLHDFVSNHSRTSLTLPVQLSSSKLAKLPTGPGVYIFKDSQQLPLYVGKSITIKDRILSHFYSDLHSPKELRLKQQTASIETIETAGNISALILESTLIHKLNPPFNRAGRKPASLFYLQSQPNQQGYLTLTITPLKSLPQPLPQNILSIAASRSALLTIIKKLTTTHQLCPKLTGLDHSRSACFAHALNQCSGACIGQESPTTYNHRLQKAFAGQALNSWPFPHPILLTETNPSTGITNTFTLNHWCITASNLTTLETSADFNYSHYRLFNKLFTHPLPANITLQPAL